MTAVFMSRRDLFRFTAAGFAGMSASGWLPALAADTAGHPDRWRSCILLWMAGGPSQLDTLDVKQGHANGGPVTAIDTSVPGIQISEYLPQLAKQMEHVAIIRSMHTREGDHARGTYHLRTGYRPQGPVHYPTLGSLLSKELGGEEAELPNYISIGPNRFLSPAAYGPGFLGPRYAPLVVGGPAVGPRPQPGNRVTQSLRVRNLARPRHVSREQADARLGLLGDLESDFAASRGGALVAGHQTAYEKAVRMMRSESVRAFDVEQESEKLRSAYGRNQFGQGCLLARRLVERGVPFVEVTLNGWDTHRDNFNTVKRLCSTLDPAWATLVRDLRDRGLLESTLIVWMGEFGRTPRINPANGRDHFPAAWSTALAGGGVKGGQVVGRTDDDGMQARDRPVPVSDFIATVCRGLGVDPMRQNLSNVGRPIRLADPEAQPIDEVIDV